MAWISTVENKQSPKKRQENHRLLVTSKGQLDFSSMKELKSVVEIMAKNCHKMTMYQFMSQPCPEKCQNNGQKWPKNGNKSRQVGVVTNSNDPCVSSLVSLQRGLEIDKKIREGSISLIYSIFSSKFSVIVLMFRRFSMNYQSKPWSLLFCKQRKSFKKLITVVGQRMHGMKRVKPNLLDVMKNLLNLFHG